MKNRASDGFKKGADRMLRGLPEHAAKQSRALSMNRDYSLCPIALFHRA